MPVYGYDAFKDQMQTGCCILWQGNNWLSRLIRIFSLYSHASLVLRINEYTGVKEEVFIVEALESGLELRGLWERIQGYNGRVFIFTPVWLTVAIRDSIGAFGLKECARAVPYNYGGLFKNILGHVSQHAHRWFCSQFVWAAYEDAAPNYLRATEKAPRPGDITLWTAGSIDEIIVPGRAS